MSIALRQPRALNQLVRSTRKRGLRESLRIGMQLLRGRWYLRGTGAELARVRGRVLLTNKGAMQLGRKLRLDGTLVPIELIAFGGVLTIGDGTYINYGTNISSTRSVSIGRNCLIGQYSIIMDDDYHSAYDHSKPGRRAPVVIEDDAWLGARVIVLRGSRIGRGAVIGANSVVAGEIPPYTVAAGSPAKVIRELWPRD